MSDSTTEQMKNFCMIQLQIKKEREMRLRKELLDCKIQHEFLTDFLNRTKEGGNES